MAEPVVAEGIMSVAGLKALGAKTLMVIVNPVFGFAVLAGVIGAELWKAKKDSQEIEAKKAAAQ